MIYYIAWSLGVPGLRLRPSSKFAAGILGVFGSTSRGFGFRAFRVLLRLLGPSAFFFFGGGGASGYLKALWALQKSWKKALLCRFSASSRAALGPERLPEMLSDAVVQFSSQRGLRSLQGGKSRQNPLLGFRVSGILGLREMQTNTTGSSSLNRDGSSMKKRLIRGFPVQPVPTLATLNPGSQSCVPYPKASRRSRPDTRKP